MKLKRILSIALTLTMVLALSVPAMAAEQTKTTNITGTTQTATISVVVPATGKVIVNPYQMEVDISEDQDGSELVQDQIISATQQIANTGEVPLNVSIAVTGTVAGQAKLATSTWTTEPTTNTVFMYFEILPNGDGTADPAWAGSYDKTKTDSQIIVATSAKTVKDMFTLDEKDGDNYYAAFHLAGEAASTPVTAWTAADKVDVAVAFTFTPTSLDVTTGGRYRAELHLIRKF